MMPVLWVALGGAVGSAARYWVSGLVIAWAGPEFPWGTLAVNFVGSFLLAVLAQLGLSTTWLTPEAKLALATGVMGGFTTYSTFSLETFQYFDTGAWTLGIANVVATVLGCLVATMFGFLFARWLVSA